MMMPPAPGSQLPAPSSTQRSALAAPRFPPAMSLPWATQLTCSLTFKKALADIFTRVHDFIHRAVRAGNYGTLKC